MQHLLILKDESERHHNPSIWRFAQPQQRASDFARSHWRARSSEMASNTDSIVSQSHPVPSNEIVAPSHRSNQQHVRQGNDYQNVSVGEGGRAILGNVYADSFSMNVLDPSQRPQKT
jgi:hypothetical protein